MADEEDGLVDLLETMKRAGGAEQFAETVLDNRNRIAGSIIKGVTYERDRLTRENLDEFLSARVGAGDLLLDLAWNIDNPTILQWCRDHGVRYLNTSVEVFCTTMGMRGHWSRGPWKGPATLTGGWFGGAHGGDTNVP